MTEGGGEKPLDPRLPTSGTSVEDDREWSETSHFHLLGAGRKPA